MENQILKNGIYFRQYDEKIEGYYIKNEYGDIIHQEYKEATTLQKMKFKLKYGYSMNTSTICTSYYYFNPNSEDFYSNTMKGDAITIGGYCKNGKYLGSPTKYTIENNKIIVDNDYSRTIIMFSNDFKSINAECFNLKTNKRTFLGIYAFLDFNII